MTTPLLCIPIAFLLIYLPHLITVSARWKQPEGFDNAHPRDQVAKLTGWGRRAAAAHTNGFESFAPFAAAVLVAHVAGADPRFSTLLALVYVGARALYPFLYVGDVDKARSGVWLVGFGATLGLFLLPLVK